MCCKCGESPVCDILEHMLRHKLLSCVRVPCVTAVGLSHVQSCVWLHFIMQLQLFYHDMSCCNVCHVQLHASRAFMIWWRATVCSVTRLWWLGHMCSYHMFFCHLLQAHGLDMWFMCLLSWWLVQLSHSGGKISHVSGQVFIVWWHAQMCSVTLSQVCHMLMCANTFLSLVWSDIRSHVQTPCLQSSVVDTFSHVFWQVLQHTFGMFWMSFSHLVICLAACSVTYFFSAWTNACPLVDHIWPCLWSRVAMLFHCTFDNVFAYLTLQLLFLQLLKWVFFN